MQLVAVQPSAGKEERVRVSGAKQSPHLQPNWQLWAQLGCFGSLRGAIREKNPHLARTPLSHPQHSQAGATNGALIDLLTML